MKKHPGINPEIIAAGIYYDALMPYTERIGVEVTLDAEASSESAHALTYVSVTGAVGENVQLRDDVSGESFEIKPRIVVNAAGAWIDFVNRRMNHQTRMIGGTKGSHIIVDHPELLKVLDGHVLYFENKDGRLLVILPLEDRVMIGTSDIRIDDPDEAICTDDEIDYFLTSLAIALPNVEVKREQIVYHFSGVRPLPSSEAGFAGMISRDHSIQVIEPDDAIRFPIYSLVGGKWTTFRAFSEEVTDKVSDYAWAQPKNNHRKPAYRRWQGLPAQRSANAKHGSSAWKQKRTRQLKGWKRSSIATAHGLNTSPLTSRQASLRLKTNRWVAHRITAAARLCSLRRTKKSCIWTT